MPSRDQMCLYYWLIFSWIINELRKIFLHRPGKNGLNCQRNIYIWVKSFFALGITGTGKQFLSWIHISDVVGIFVHALENENVSGVLNFTSPQPVTNEEFTKQLASALWRPAFIPMPAFVVNWLFGPERTTLLLEGLKVIPKRTLESGYSFLFPDIKSCLHDIVKWGNFATLYYCIKLLNQTEGCLTDLQCIILLIKILFYVHCAIIQ